MKKKIIVLLLLLWSVAGQVQPKSRDLMGVDFLNRSNTASRNTNPGTDRHNVTSYYVSKNPV